MAHSARAMEKLAWMNVIDSNCDRADEMGEKQMAVCKGGIWLISLPLRLLTRCYDSMLPAVYSPSPGGECNRRAGLGRLAANVM